MSRLHRENHLVSRIGWLRAAVLGANDGIVSTASLIMGVRHGRRQYPTNPGGWRCRSRRRRDVHGRR
ncbi:hypothetical protein J2046_006110 [Rhizobium petrolearium]|nr:hypothetical protein [Neorhizobium petrolearium]